MTMEQPSEKQPLIGEHHARQLLEEYYSPISDLEYLQGGKHSTAYAFTSNNRKLVARFNQNQQGFEKDSQANEILKPSKVPTAFIERIETLEENLFLAISEHLPGQTIKQRYREQDFSSLPAQFEMIEAIAQHTQDGFATSALEKIKSLSGHTRATTFDWDLITSRPYFNQDFYKDLLEKASQLASYSPNSAKSLVHGDFGNENILIDTDNNITGVLDWANSFYGDHFFDVGRVVLYCPDRRATTGAALAFYSQTEHANYRERISLGVMTTMLANYQHAASEGHEASCVNSPKRIMEYEQLVTELA